METDRRRESDTVGRAGGDDGNANSAVLAPGERGHLQLVVNVRDLLGLEGSHVLGRGSVASGGYGDNVPRHTFGPVLIGKPAIDSSSTSYASDGVANGGRTITEGQVLELYLLLTWVRLSATGAFPYNP